MTDRYPFLGFVLKFFKVIAYGEVILAFILAAVIIVAGVGLVSQYSFVSGVGALVGVSFFAFAVVIGAVIHAIWSLAIVEFFRCVMDIERNTRLTENDKYVLTKV